MGRVVGLVFEPIKKSAPTKGDIITMLQAKGIEFNPKMTKEELEALLNGEEKAEGNETEG